MSVKLSCTQCEKEATGVCHHCGRPLCQTHQIELVDERLNQHKEVVTALHCQQCRKVHHRFGGNAVLNQIQSRITRFLP